MKKLAFVLVILSNATFAQKMSQKMAQNGVIYKQHPYIEIIKRLASLYEKGDADGMAKYYADTAHLYGMTRYNPDTSLLEKHLMPKAKAVMEAKVGWQQIIDGWENIKMTPLSPPDGLQYANSQFTVQSWWLLTLTNKKTHKTAATEMVLFDTFNKDGKIAVQLEYYDPTSLMMAMK
ncbi:MAG TPA: hypothetical protein VG367_17140 [Mucilaginibacter sp.]|jgi:hypothetical protein|nr:hypothetical protein [Mucilaginibacter sp.]